MKISKKIKAFTLAEAIITIVILGIIAAFGIPQLIFGNHNQDGLDTMAKKMSGYLTQASTEILLYDSVLDDFTRLKAKDGSYFSIADSDAEEKMAKLYQKYLSDIDYKVDYDNAYFSFDLVDREKNSLGFKVKDRYSSFFHVNDGVLIAFKFYGNCTTTETNSFPPEFKQKYSVNNICGSIFYDVNSYSKPNRLGLDQYILPVGKRGIKYEDI